MDFILLYGIEMNEKKNTSNEFRFHHRESSQNEYIYFSI